MGIDNNIKMSTYILGKKENSNIRRCDDTAFIQDVVRYMTAMKLALRMFDKIKK